MLSWLLPLALAGLVAWGLERNHRRARREDTWPAGWPPLSGASDAAGRDADRDAARTAADLRAVAAAKQQVTGVVNGSARPGARLPGRRAAVLRSAHAERRDARAQLGGKHHLRRRAPAPPRLP